MPVQVKIDPNTGLTKCGNSIEREQSIQMLFSTTMTSGNQGWGLGIPNVLRNAEQLLSRTFTNKKGEWIEMAFDPHAYWSVDHRPAGTKQIVDSGLFTFLFGARKDAPLKEIERYAEIYIEFVNNHFKKHCLTNNTPWFVELDLHGRYGLEDYHRIQKKLFDSCPDRDFIGVWHCQHGLKQLEELCERFDYIAMGSGFSTSSVESKVQGIRWLAKNHPEKCIHWLGTDNMTNLLAPQCVHTLCDTCDSTGWCTSKRYGLDACPTTYRREMVAPAIPFFNEHLYKWFPKEKGKGKNELEKNEYGITKTNTEAYLWAVLKVWLIWSNFNLYGKQKQWDRGAFRGIVPKVLSGHASELTTDDLQKPLYEMKTFKRVGTLIPSGHWFADGYENKFDDVAGFPFNV